MKVLLDIDDEKADFITELLSYFPFVRAQVLTADENNIIEEAIEDIEDIRLYDEGKREDNGERVLFTDYLQKRK